jgi:hypothetical protein
MRPLVSWIRRLARPTRPVRTGLPIASRPLCVEALEDRLLLTAYVVTTTKDILGDTTLGEVTLRGLVQNQVTGTSPFCAECCANHADPSQGLLPRSQGF